MEAYEPVLVRGAPVAVVVAGDVNSTLACSLTAARHGVPVIPLEAGLRSFARTMPEEVNRVLTDQLADLLLITSAEARDNLLAEGRPSGAIVMTGNTMIYTLFSLVPETRGIPVPEKPYGLVTLHRPGNVDRRERCPRSWPPWGGWRCRWSFLPTPEPSGTSPNGGWPVPFRKT
jgi:UDP-N-acetylglucosamine 2-epimerase (non-hydrolysing)